MCEIKEKEFVFICLAVVLLVLLRYCDINTVRISIRYGYTFGGRYTNRTLKTEVDISKMHFGGDTVYARCLSHNGTHEGELVPPRKLPCDNQPA